MLVKRLLFSFLFSIMIKLSLRERNKINATVAQSVEQLIRNQQVAGSSPASSSKIKQPTRLVVLFLFYSMSGKLYL